MPRVAKILVVLAIPLLGLCLGCGTSDLREARAAGNETSAVGTLRAIFSAQIAYAVECDGAYAPTLDRLAARNVLDTALASEASSRNGYRFAIDRPAAAQEAATTASGCDGSISEFVATAVPLEPGTTGERFFRVDPTGRIEQATNAQFTDARPLE